MPGEDAAAGILAVPIWLAGAAAAVFVVAILLAVKRAEVSSRFRPAPEPAREVEPVPLPPRRPPQVRVAPPPRAAAPP
jgi:hypothetical protein